MAFVNQELKKRLAAKVKEEVAKVIGKDTIKMSFSVNNHSTMVVTIKSGTIDFGNPHQQINHYWIESNFDGKAKDILLAIKKGLMSEHWDRSDAQVDYFDCSYYISINVGKWDKPYELIKT